MSNTAHAFVILVALPCLVFIGILVRRGALRAKYAVLWVTVGFGLIALAVWPDLVERVSKAVGIGYPPALLFVLAIIFLLVIVVHYSWELSRLEERTRILAEELALDRAGRATSGHTTREDASDRA